MRPLIKLFIGISVIIFACKRESFYSDAGAKLKFSSDTVTFDTIFTNIGSPTLQLLVYNVYDRPLKVSSIQLARGVNSHFKININGINAVQTSNVEIEPGDSLYIFIQALKSINGQDLPLLIRDSLMFNTNGNLQNIKLLAYSQDVNILKSNTLKTQVWEGSKPYLIYGSVIIDTLETLTIKDGITVYFHWNSNLIVKGTLKTEGVYKHPVIFRDDRMLKVAGQWGGIQLMSGSKGNSLSWTIIENGTSGLRMSEFNSLSVPDIEMNQVIIRNHLYNCFLAINSKVKAANCIIANGGTYTCGLVGGGDYEFTHCTFGN